MTELSVRPSAFAGQFYPADAGRLRSEVEGYIDDASLPDGLDDVHAVVAPHAGYVYSGETAGYAFRALHQLPDREWTVFLLGPAHRIPVTGVALGAFSAFRTPLGDAPVAVERVKEMLDETSFYTRSARAHQPEHCLEVEVPFLQVALPRFRLVPMLVGQARPREIAKDLRGRLGEDDLIVVSSDLSHFHTYDVARKKDQGLLDALLEGNEAGVRQGEACGRAPLTVLMAIGEAEGWEPLLLDYRNSGDTGGGKSRVVGYAAIAYTG